MRCTELVLQDHAILRRALDVLDGMVDKLERGERIEISDATATVGFIRLFGLEYHHRAEERVLFPALARLAPQQDIIAALVFEHEEQRRLAATIEDVLGIKNGAEFVKKANGLLVLLRNHLDKEEAFLRNLPALSLSVREDEALAADYARQRPKEYLNFQRLERKYAVVRIAAVSRVRERGRVERGI